MSEQMNRIESLLLEMRIDMDEISHKKTFTENLANKIVDFAITNSQTLDVSYQYVKNGLKFPKKKHSSVNMIILDIEEEVKSFE